MNQNIKGEWIKYEKQPGKWGSTESSYTKLCADLEKHQNTGWNLGVLADYIYGEFLPCHGTMLSDIYVYYIIDKKSGKRKPKLYLAVHSCDDGKNYADILGIKRRIKPNSKKLTFDPEVKYASIVLEKLQELNAKDWIIKEYEESSREYQALDRINKDGIKTHEDILTIYRNLSRIDTRLAFKLIKGRNIQADYDSLNEEEKVAFVKIICSLSSEVKEELAELTNTKGLILSVREIEVLKKTATDTNLLCLWLAPKEYLQNKEIILEILSEYDIKNSSTLGISAISENFQIDVDILHALAKKQPYQLYFILNSLSSKINKNRNTLLESRFKDKEYMIKLLDMHFRNIINNPAYIKESFIPADTIWFFNIEMLENIESEILYGPFATPEEEQMKDKIKDVIRLERTKIKEFKAEHPEYYN